MSSGSEVGHDLHWTSSAKETAFLPNKDESTRLICRDPICQSSPHALSRNVTGNEIGESSLEMRKEAEDCDLERVRGVGVDFVVGLEYDEAFLFVRVSGRD